MGRVGGALVVGLATVAVLGCHRSGGGETKGVGGNVPLADVRGALCGPTPASLASPGAMRAWFGACDPESRSGPELDAEQEWVWTHSLADVTDMVAFIAVRDDGDTLTVELCRMPDVAKSKPDRLAAFLPQPVRPVNVVDVGPCADRPAAANPPTQFVPPDPSCWSGAPTADRAAIDAAYECAWLASLGIDTAVDWSTQWVWISVWSPYLQPTSVRAGSTEIEVVAQGTCPGGAPKADSPRALALPQPVRPVRITSTPPPRDCPQLP